MALLDELVFLSGAIARKDYVASLCHFLIKNKRGLAYDGLVSLSTPIELDLHVKPHARRMIQVIKACEDNGAIAMHVTPAGKLSIKSGKFKAFVDCLNDEEAMHVPQPEGDRLEINSEVFIALRTLAPYISLDASRPWARGIRLCGQSAFVTNNIIFIEYWHGCSLAGDSIIPEDTIEQLIKIKNDPIAVQGTSNSMTFHFPDDRWMRTQLIDGKWPENIERVFEGDVPPVGFPEGFFDALRTLKPFVDDRGRVYLLGDRISTSLEEGEGASVEIDVGISGPVFHLSQLQLLEDVATCVDFTAWPNPCRFFGKKMRGVIVGLRS